MTIEELQSQIDEKWHVLAKLVQHLAVGNGYEVRQALGALQTAAEEYAVVRTRNQRAIARLIDVQGVPAPNLCAEAARKMRERLVDAAKPESNTEDHRQIVEDAIPRAGLCVVCRQVVCEENCPDREP